jgi:predicted amidophosphoribosyltransferase
MSVISSANTLRARATPSAPRINWSLISRSLSTSGGTPQWQYKDRAIGEAAAAFRTALTGELLDRITLVPIPPSKAKSDPLYDDRLVRMLHAIRPQPRLDIRELILQRVSTAAVHDQANRPRPEEIQANYAIDCTLMDPRPETVGLVDDVLTTGAHFRAACTVIRQVYLDVHLIGLFIARRVPETMDFENFDF